MTPLVDSIEPSGSHWLWTLQGVGALGLNLDAAFTERMEFDDERQIRFSHDPPNDKREMAGLEGVYDLAPAGEQATSLKVDLTLSVELPLPGLSKRAVESMLELMMRTTGQMFAANLYERLGLDPSHMEITELS